MARPIEPPILIDAWTPLEYKTGLLANKRERGESWMAPDWMGEHRRRCQAYTFLEALYLNSSRIIIDTVSPMSLEERRILEAERQKRREYGDARLLVEQIRSALMGDQQTVTVKGADEYDPNAHKPKPVPQPKPKPEIRDRTGARVDEGDTPDQPPNGNDETPQNPEDPKPKNDPRVQNVPDGLKAQAQEHADQHDAEQAMLAEEPDIPPEERKDRPELKAAFERQEFLQEWAEAERLVPKIVETERNSVMKGDGVYSLGWSTDKKRPVLRTWDPACYFPVIEDSDDAEYPRKVHLAWELAEDELDENGNPYPDDELRIHRITYELVETAAAQAPLENDEEPAGNRVVRGLKDAVRQAVGAGTQQEDNPEAQDQPATFTVPWEEEPPLYQCHMTEAVYTIKKDARNPDDLGDATAQYIVDEAGEVNNRPLGIDFIPVVHVPNTVAIANHYGSSVLSSVLQILDDVQQTDSDLQASASITGSPIGAVSGSAPQDGKLTVGPGEVWWLGENGSAEFLSGAEGLEALANHLERLLKRVSVNARVPEAILGRVDPGQVEAGIVLALSFGPLKALIDEMRLVRKDKYRLLLKFVQRFYMLEGEIDGEILDADVAFGAYMPNDLTTTTTTVTTLHKEKLISRETAMKMLMEAGVPIEDVTEEIAAIDRRDFEGANLLADATGNDAAVEEMLGVKTSRPEPPPIIVPGGDNPEDNLPPARR